MVKKNFYNADRNIHFLGWVCAHIFGPIPAKRWALADGIVSDSLAVKFAIRAHVYIVLLSFSPSAARKRTGNLNSTTTGGDDDVVNHSGSFRNWPRDERPKSVVERVNSRHSYLFPCTLMLLLYIYTTCIFYMHVHAFGIFIIRK